MAKGKMGIPKCMKMLSLVPKAVLNGWKKAAAKMSMIYVVMEKSMKVLEIPCVKNDNFLVLHTKELKI